MRRFLEDPPVYLLHPVQVPCLEEGGLEPLEGEEGLGGRRHVKALPVEDRVLQVFLLVVMLAEPVERLGAFGIDLESFPVRLKRAVRLPRPSHGGAAERPVAGDHLRRLLVPDAESLPVQLESAVALAETLVDPNHLAPDARVRFVLPEQVAEHAAHFIRVVDGAETV